MLGQRGRPRRWKLFRRIGVARGRATHRLAVGQCLVDAIGEVARERRPRAEHERAHPRAADGVGDPRRGAGALEEAGHQQVADESVVKSKTASFLDPVVAGAGRREEGGRRSGERRAGERGGGRARASAAAAHLASSKIGRYACTNRYAHLPIPWEARKKSGAHGSSLWLRCHRRPDVVVAPFDSHDGHSQPECRQRWSAASGPASVPGLQRPR